MREWPRDPSSGSHRQYRGHENRVGFDSDTSLALAEELLFLALEKLRSDYSD